VQTEPHFIANAKQGSFALALYAKKNFLSLGPRMIGGALSFAFWVDHLSFQTFSRVVDFGCVAPRAWQPTPLSSPPLPPAAGLTSLGLAATGHHWTTSCLQMKAQATTYGWIGFLVRPRRWRRGAGVQAVWWAWR
jgi:hypothetical protein